MNRILPLLLISLVFTLSAGAQAPFKWGPEQVPSCSPGSSIVSVEDLRIYSLGCSDVELISNDETLRITSSQLEDNPQVYASGFDVDNTWNQLAGDPLTSGSLAWDIDGDLDLIDPDASRFRFSYQYTDGTYEFEYVTVSEMLLLSEACPFIVNGGTRISVVNFTIFYTDDWVDGTPVDLSLSYTFTPQEITALSEIIVPDEVFNGNAYEYELPSGHVNFKNTEFGLPIGLENNTPTEQQINISKVGGLLSFSSSSFLAIQRASMSGEKHAVDFNLKGVDLCLGTFEFFVDTAANLILDNTNIYYEDSLACILLSSSSSLTVPIGGYQRLGDEGLGMQVWRASSSTEVREDATLVLDNVFSIRTSGARYINVYPGAHLEVTEHTSLSTSSLQGTGVFHVNLYQGATFDMSAAPSEVQDLFTVNLVSSNQDILASGDYTVFPNPTFGSTTFVKTSSSGSALQSIEVIDMSGRVLTINETLLGVNRHAVELPSTGVFVLRLTDIDGRVGHTKIVRQ